MGRPLARLLMAVLLAVAALGCSSDDASEETTGSSDDVLSSERSTTTSTTTTSTTTTSTTTSSTTTTTTTTTTAPPTTAAPTTAAPPPPPPPPTTAPPPPPPTTAPPPPPTTQPPPPQPSGGNSGCESYMRNAINSARANNGLAGLTNDGGIYHVAYDWSVHMRDTQTLAHNPNYGSQIARYRNYRTAGENVGRGYDQASLFRAFMDSPGHRANILNSAYSHMTVGCVTDGGGQLWVTQNFWG